MSKTPNASNKGILISFEGIEGVGKSTQVQMLTEALTTQGIACTKTREPGGTSVGNQIRSCLLQEHDFPLHSQTELCLLLAARFDHWHNIVAPALQKGNVVIVDRFIDASIAYQGYGRELGSQKVKDLHEELNLWIEPDVTFLLDMPIEISRKRLDTRGFSDRIEKEKDIFFQKVRQGYLEQAQRYERIHVIDAQQSKEDISEQISSHVKALLEKNYELSLQT